MTDRPTKPTLRGLARELGVAHSALSAAAHEGRLTDGIALEHGRVRVVDATAAAAQWRSVHVTRIDYAESKRMAAHATTPAPAVFYDASGLDWTPGQLLRWHEALDLLVCALVGDALDRESWEALVERVGGRLGDHDDDLPRRLLLGAARRAAGLDLEDDRDDDALDAPDDES